jgi:two-component system phosphate regulon response regulator PhoB
MWKILLVEESVDVAERVATALGDDFDVTTVGTAFAARECAVQTRFDLVILDVSLPDGDGFDLCRSFQEDPLSSDTAIVFLSARSDTEERIAAFSVGADDYLEQPFDRRELRARVMARLRRIRDLRRHDSQLERGDLKLDLARQRAVLSDGPAEEELDLTPHEFRLLFQLARDEDHPLSRDQLMRSVWGNVVVYERTIDSHLSNLRKKLGTRSGYIQSVRGVGYRFSTQSARHSA